VSWRMWACRGSESSVSDLTIEWCSVVVGSGVARSSRGRSSGYFRPSPSIYSWFESSEVFFHLIWLLCVWILWNDRNDRLFRNKQSSLLQMLDKVKSYSLWWLKASNVVFSFGTHAWWSNLL